MSTRPDLVTRLGKLRVLLNTNVTFQVHQYPVDYHTPAFAGRWYADVELPNCESLAYDKLLTLTECLGTTTINFNSASEQGYYGSVNNIVRLWVCW